MKKLFQFIFLMLKKAGCCLMQKSSGQRRVIKAEDRGVSIIGSLLGFSMLGLSTIGLASYMNSFEQVRETHSKQVNLYFHHQSLLKRASDILTKTRFEIDTTGALVSRSNELRDQGICALVDESISYSTMENKMYGKIEASASDILSDKSGMNSNRWKYFITHDGIWEDAVSASDCSSSADKGFLDTFSNAYNKRCFKWKPQNNSTEEIYARVTITPVKLPGFNEVKTTTGDVLIDELAFEIESLVSSRLFSPQSDNANAPQFTLSSQKHLVFAGEVSECDIYDSGAGRAKVAVLYGGISSGRESKDLFYHSPQDHPDICSAVDVSHVFKSVLQRGNFASSSNFIVQSDTSHNVGMSCTANLFKCKSAGNSVRFDPKNFDPVIQANFNIEVDSPVDTTVDYLEAAIKSSSKSFNHSTTFTNADQQTYIGQIGSTKETYSTSADDTWLLNSGGNMYRMTVANESGSDSICMDACANPNTFYPELKLKWNTKKSNAANTCAEKTISLNTSGAKDGRIACTTCHAKSCHRFGLGTFGSKSSQPSEPVDGNIPECGGASNAEYELDSSTATQLSNKCMAVQSSKLYPTSCSSNTPTETICFINGEAQAVPKSLTLGSSTIDIGKRHSACFRASIERLRLGNEKTKGLLANMALAYMVSPSGSNKAVKEILIAQGLTESGSGTDKYFEIYNSASQGVFLPFKASSSNRAWINIERDHSGMLISGLHNIPDLLTGTGKPADQSRKNWAFFFRQPFQTISFRDAQSISIFPTGESQGTFLGRARPARPMFLNFENIDPDFPNSPASTTTDKTKKRLLLTHHIHYKGARVVADTQSEEYALVCIANSSSKTASLSSTTTTAFPTLASSCNPPITAEQWTDALLAIAPNAPRYPFPNPFAFEDGIPFTLNVYDHTKTDLLWDFTDFNTNDYTDSRDIDNDFIFNSLNMPTSGGVVHNNCLSTVATCKTACDTANPNTCNTQYPDNCKSDEQCAIDNFNELHNCCKGARGVSSCSEFANNTTMWNFVKSYMDLGWWSSCWDNSTSFGQCMNTGDTCRATLNTNRTTCNNAVNAALGTCYTACGSCTAPSVMSPPRSAWIPLKPRKYIKGTPGTVDHADPGDRIDTWMVDLDEQLRFPINSVFKITTSTQAKDELKLLTDNDSTNAPTYPGVLNYDGVLMERKDVLEMATDLDEVYSKLVKPCRVKSDETDYEYHLAPAFVGDTSSSSTWGDDCGDINYETVDKANVEDLDGADIDQIKGSVQGALNLRWKFYDEQKIALFDNDRFCTEWHKEKERRAVGRCLISAFNNGNLGGKYGETPTANCRKSARNHKCTSEKSGADSSLASTRTSKDSACTSAKGAYTSCTGTISSCKSGCASGTPGDSCRDTCDNKCNSLETSRKNTCATAACYNDTDLNYVTADCQSAMPYDTGSSGSTTYSYTVSGSGTAYGKTKTCSITHASINYNGISSSSAAGNYTNYKACWSVVKLNPQSETRTIDSQKGKVGFVGNEDGDTQYWTEDETCQSTHTLKTLNDDCDDKYKEPVDESVVCGTQTVTTSCSTITTS